MKWLIVLLFALIGAPGVGLQILILMAARQEPEVHKLDKDGVSGPVEIKPGKKIILQSKDGKHKVEMTCEPIKKVPFPDPIHESDREQIDLAIKHGSPGYADAGIRTEYILEKDGRTTLVVHAVAVVPHMEDRRTAEREDWHQPLNENEERKRQLVERWVWLLAAKECRAFGATCKYGATGFHDYYRSGCSGWHGLASWQWWYMPNGIYADAILKHNYEKDGHPHRFTDEHTAAVTQNTKADLEKFPKWGYKRSPVRAEKMPDGKIRTYYLFDGMNPELPDNPYEDERRAKNEVRR